MASKAEDITQEVFITLYTKLDTFRVKHLFEAGITQLPYDALLQYIYDLGEPYHKSGTGIDWYYDKDTNQLLRISETAEGKMSINIRYKNTGDAF